MTRDEFIRQLRHVQLESRDLYIELLKDKEDYDAADSVLDNIDGSIDELIAEVENLYHLLNGGLI